ncbi:hypothetical protein L1987_70383 [Smallanthus sonchifolius]|uniref:Uncharacterized protein n=1 Tax=Smallanthus sonchifolius TaxID=185202 RepID=A0ACB9ATT0_9ASTR|nr:hypothetical protein L1987_70383 [Smallanthus sonchifolius]
MGRSKGYGVVKFADEMEINHCSNAEEAHCLTTICYPKRVYEVAVHVDTDLTNTTEELRQIFLQFGEIVYVKIPTAKGCEFVQFTTRTSAEEEIKRMHGSQIGQLVVHLSWGKSKRDSYGVWAPLADPTQWSSAHYGYGEGYDAYAYGTTQDPSLYAYGGYMQTGAGGTRYGRCSGRWSSSGRCCTTCGTKRGII